MQFTEDDIISGDKYLLLQSDIVAYIKTDILVHNMSSILWTETIQPLHTWITGHSDFPIDKEIFNRYQHNCQSWFAINTNYEHPKLINLPLGITNNTNESELHPIYGNTQIMMEVMRQPKIDRNLVYMNFSIHTYPSERQSCYDIFKDKSWVTVGTTVNTLEGRHNFLSDIRNHTFVLCPRGNGIDTHRLWETLYMGSIPIVKRYIGLKEFTDLPILMIDDWSNITEDLLRATAQDFVSRTWSMEKLKFSYWKQRIQSQGTSLNLYNTLGKRRIALLFFGLTRSLDKTIDSIKQQLLQPLRDNLFDYDIFIHTYKIYGEYHNIWSNEHISEYINEDVIRILNPTYYLEDNQQDIIDSINFDEYYTKLGEWSGGFPPELVQTLIKHMTLALYSKKRITKLFEEYKGNYDYAMIVRPDMFYKTTLDIKWLFDITDNAILMPFKDWYNNGCNDRFCIAKPDTIVYYGKLFDDLKEYSKQKSITSEKYLFDKLNEQQIKIIAKDIDYDMIRMS
jgi:hypothetical protein